MSVEDVANKLNLVYLIKNAEKTAIVTAGVPVPDDTPFSYYPEKISDISYGGVTPPTPQEYGDSSVIELPLSDIGITSSDVVCSFISRKGNIYISCNKIGFGLHTYDEITGAFIKIFDYPSYITAFKEVDEGLIYCTLAPLGEAGILKIVEAEAITVTKLLTTSILDIISSGSGNQRKTFFYIDGGNTLYEGEGSLGVIKDTTYKFSNRAHQTNEALYISDVNSNLYALNTANGTFSLIPNKPKYIYDSNSSKTYFYYATTGTLTGGQGLVTLHMACSDGTTGMPLTYVTLATGYYNDDYFGNGVPNVISWSVATTLSNKLVFSIKLIEHIGEAQYNKELVYIFTGSSIINLPTLTHTNATRYMVHYTGQLTNGKDVLVLDTSIYTLDSANAIVYIGYTAYYTCSYILGNDIIYSYINDPLVTDYFYKINSTLLLNQNGTAYWDVVTHTFKPTQAVWNYATSGYLTYSIDLNNNICIKGPFDNYLYFYNTVTNRLDLQIDNNNSPLNYGGIFKNYGTEKFFLYIDDTKRAKLYRKGLTNVWERIPTSDNNTIDFSKVVDFTIYEVDTNIYISLIVSSSGTSYSDLTIRNLLYKNNMLTYVGGFGGKQLTEKLYANYLFYSKGSKTYSTLGDYSYSAVQKNTNYFSFVSANNSHIMFGGQ